MTKPFNVCFHKIGPKNFGIQISTPPNIQLNAHGYNTKSGAVKAWMAVVRRMRSPSFTWHEIQTPLKSKKR